MEEAPGAKKHWNELSSGHHITGIGYIIPVDSQLGGRDDNSCYA
jgi:hypothetical protein